MSNVRTQYLPIAAQQRIGKRLSIARSDLDISTCSYMKYAQFSANTGNCVNVGA